MFELVVSALLLSTGIVHSAPIQEECSIPVAKITNETWPKLIENIVNCMQNAVNLKDTDKYERLMALAQELANVANQGLSDDNMTADDTMVPAIVPENKHSELNEVLLEHLKRETGKLKTKLMIIDLSGAKRMNRFQFDNGIVLIILSAFLALSAMLAVVELYMSWKKYDRSRRLSQIIGHVTAPYKYMTQPKCPNGVHGCENINGMVI